MKKCSNHYQSRDCGQYSAHILPRFASKNQAFKTKFSYSSHNLPEISQLIKQNRLSDCLDWLQEKDTGERAILMLAYLQGGTA